MQVSARSYLTAGIAVLGAGAIALSPIQPVATPTALSPMLTKAVAVNLAAAIDPITPIITTIQTTLANTTALISDWIANPFPIGATVVNNWLYYLTELPDIGTIVSQVFGNIPNAIQAPFDPGTISAGGIANPPAGVANGDYISDVPFTFVNTGLPAPFPAQIDLSQKDVYGFLTDLLPVETTTALAPVLNFLNTPISGTLLGLVGPVVAPFVALSNGIRGAIAALQTQDWGTAINDLINIPTNMINAALNGTTLDLTPLAGSILPPQVTKIGLALGGLLTTFTSPEGVALPGTQVGGVGFNALAVTASLDPGTGPITITDPGLGIGLVGGLVSLTRSIAGGINRVPTEAAATRRGPAARAAAAKPAAKAATARSAAARHAS
ncbi:MAG: outer membrane porin GjpA [Candidatus Nanopelagicales bacterium]